MKQEISFTVTSITAVHRRKSEGEEESSKLVLNSENQEKCEITAPEGSAFDDVQPGDVVKLRVAVKQKKLVEQEKEAEEKAKPPLPKGASEEKKKEEATA